jgi:hypothetical protein
MKLYEVPNNTRVRLVPETEVKIPVGSTLPVDEFMFHKIDGMYSYCTTDAGEVAHPAAWTEVEIVQTENNP